MSRTRLTMAIAAALALTTPLGGCVLPPGVLGPTQLSGGRLTFAAIDIDPAKSSVSVGETIRLGVRTNLDPSGLSFTWSATGGELSSGYGQQVTWTATGPGRAVVTCQVSSGETSQVAQVAFTAR